MPETPPVLISTLGDPQSRGASSRTGLGRVGVTGVERVLPLSVGGVEQPLRVELDLAVALDATRRGAHMSRFEEAIDQAVEGLARSGAALSPDRVAAAIAECARLRQGTARAEARLSGRVAGVVRTPSTGVATQRFSTVLGAAVAVEGRAERRALGVQAEGTTACPCAQEAVAARARVRLAEEGFDADEIDRVLAAVPVATHNQRGLGTLWAGVVGAEAVGAEAIDLLSIVERSMSAEVYELLKRPDEADVVERAHARPRFVEDCVREMVRLGLEELSGLDGRAFLSARQENLESIHHHDVVAERSGTVEELRAELGGEDLDRPPVELAAWLGQP
jgi:GTP cyclohydrolase I/GTP cyclohydrolase-4